MSQVVPADVPFPDIPATKDLEVAKGVVFFKNFAVNSAEPTAAHKAFIPTVARFLVAQIDKLGFADNRLTLHLFGEASATGAAAKNLTLSQARAQAIGEKIKQQFDIQKMSSALARNISVEIDARGLGKTDATVHLLAVEAQTHRHFTSAQIEAGESDFRMVFLKITAQHDVVDNDKVVLVREVFGCKFKDEVVPLNLLDQKLDELSKNSVLAAAFGFLFGVVKSELKTVITQLIKNAEFAAPEIIIIFSGVEFITPSDASIGFQFKDSRGRLQLYKLRGTLNSKDFNLFDLISFLISFTDWMKKVDKAIDDLMAAKLNLNIIQLQELNAQLARTKRILKQLLNQFSEKLQGLLRPGGAARRLLGDGLSDTLLGFLEKGFGKDIIIFSDFARVVFSHPGVFDISTFAGPARALSTTLLGSADVDLEFLGAGPEGLLGFNGRADIKHSVGTGIVLAGAALIRGNLFPQASILA